MIYKTHKKMKIVWYPFNHFPPRQGTHWRPPVSVVVLGRCLHLQACDKTFKIYIQVQTPRIKRLKPIYPLSLHLGDPFGHVNTPPMGRTLSIPQNRSKEGSLLCTNLKWLETLCFLKPFLKVIYSTCSPTLFAKVLVVWPIYWRL